MRSVFTTLFLIPFTLFAQSLDFSTTSLSFPSVFYPGKDSMSVTITNNYSVNVQITGISMYEKYKDKPFYVKDSVFVLVAGQSKTIWVYFEPEQNIAYNLEAIVRTNYRGTYAIDLKGKGKFANTYYNSTFGKTEQDLKNTLKSILTSGFTPGTYSSARDRMFMVIDNKKVNGQGASQNTIEGVYTGQQIVGYTSRTDAQNQGFNTEHTFPQGFFSSNEPMRSDLHHLFPTNATANSQRGNLPFGEVTGTPTWSVGGSKKGGGKFEPRDVQKGPTARAMLYFVIKYQDYGNFLSGQEQVLRDWHGQYAPTLVEKKRNDDIYTFQKNRNPFVDYPQFIKRITRVSGNSVAPDHYSIQTPVMVSMLKQTKDLHYFITIMNSGNKDIDLTDFAISGTGVFSFATPMPDTLLKAGDALQIKLLVNPDYGKEVTEFLTFDSSIPSHPGFSIKLYGDWIGVVGIASVSTPDIGVYPNPVDDQLNIEVPAGTRFVYTLTGTDGRTVRTGEVNGQGQLSVNNLHSGVYILMLQSDKSTIYRKIIIQ